MASNRSSTVALLLRSYSNTWAAVHKTPRIYLPFLIFAGFELLSLVLMYLAPRVPLRAVMGPIITTFWGDEFLHYPKNFFLLPKLAGLARMTLTIFLGSLLTGMAVAFLYKKPAALAWKKYANLFLIVFLLTTLFYLINKVTTVCLLHYFQAGHEKLFGIGAREWLGPVNIAVSQVLALILQAFFAYAIPVLLLSEKKFTKAIGESFGFCVRNMGATLLIVGLPMVLAVPLMVLNYNGAYLMVRSFPEIIVWLGVLGIVVNSLLLDPLITLVAARFYADNRGQK